MKNNNSRPVFKRNDSDDEVNRFGSDNMEYAKKSKKSKKLSKSGKSKSEKTTKFKKPLKSRNSPKFNTKKARPSFLTPGAKTNFNCLWLAFTKALIL